MSRARSLEKFCEKLATLGLSDELLEFSRDLVTEVENTSSAEILGRLNVVLTTIKPLASGQVHSPASVGANSTARMTKLLSTRDQLTFSVFLRRVEQHKPPSLMVLPIDAMRAMGFSTADRMDVTPADDGIICRINRNGGYAIRLCSSDDLDDVVLCHFTWRICRGRLFMTYLPADAKSAINLRECDPGLYVVVEPQHGDNKNVERCLSEQGRSDVDRPDTIQAHPINECCAEGERGTIKRHTTAHRSDVIRRKSKPILEMVQPAPRLACSRRSGELITVSLVEVIGLLQECGVQVKIMGPNVFETDGKIVGKADLVEILNRIAKIKGNCEYVLVMQSTTEGK